ncbi:hypothetical protein BJ508DRAFT_335545, partial [Ascobolus immersus RN42]
YKLIKSHKTDTLKRSNEQRRIRYSARLAARKDPTKVKPVSAQQQETIQMMRDEIIRLEKIRKSRIEASKKANGEILRDLYIREMSQRAEDVWQTLTNKRKTQTVADNNSGGSAPEMHTSPAHGPEQQGKDGKPSSAHHRPPPRRCRLTAVPASQETGPQVNDTPPTLQNSTPITVHTSETPATDTANPPSSEPMPPASPEPCQHQTPHTNARQSSSTLPPPVPTIPPARPGQSSIGPVYTQQQVYLQQSGSAVIGVVCSTDPVFKDLPLFGRDVAGTVVVRRDKSGIGRLIMTSRGGGFECWVVGEEEYLIRRLLKEGYEVYAKGAWKRMTRETDDWNGPIVVWECDLAWTAARPVLIG